MSETKPTSGKGKAFFDRGDQVAATGNWDFAIEMYLEGLLREPDNLQRGYKKMWEVALSRKSGGAKGPGLRDKSKHKTNTKDPLVNLANATYLLAKDPTNDIMMETVLKLAWKQEYKEVVQWLADIMIERQRQEKKPSKRLCTAITDATEAMEIFDLAVRACQLALNAAPGDATLETRLGRLGAQYTLWKGRYGTNEDFTKKVKDIDVQKKLLEEDSIVKSGSFLEQQLATARKGYEDTPTVPGKINGLVNALLAFQDEAYENEAVDVLNKAHMDTKAYQFKASVGDIKIKQYTRRFRKYKEAGDMDTARKIAREQLKFETQEYRERVMNYPTDLGLKYELGRRLFLSGEIDDAIGMLQQAQRDPRKFVSTMNLLGQAFMKKEWWQEAVDTFEKSLQADITEDRAKELRYNLAAACEHQGDLAKAQEHLSHVAQVDFNFKDVRQRLEKVRNKIKEQQG